MMRGCGFPQEELAAREAQAGDIPAMASHHRKMFAEILEGTGQSLAVDRAAALERAYALKLAREMADGNCRGWIIEDRGEIVAGGALSIVSLVPTPVDLSPKVAFLHSIYTEKSHRKRGCAQKIAQAMIDYCGNCGVRRIMLNASDAGRPVYEKLGFRIIADMMRLTLG